MEYSLNVARKKILIQLQILWIKELSRVSPSNLNFSKLTFYQGVTSSNKARDGQEGVFLSFFLSVIWKCVRSVQFLKLHYMVLWYVLKRSPLSVILPIMPMIFKTYQRNYFLMTASISGKDFKLFKGTLIQIWKSALMSSSSHENNLAKISP